MGAVDDGVGREVKGGSRGFAVAGSGERTRGARPLRESEGRKHTFLSAAPDLLVRFSGDLEKSSQAAVTPGTAHTDDQFERRTIAA